MIFINSGPGGTYVLLHRPILRMIRGFTVNLREQFSVFSSLNNLLRPSIEQLGLCGF